MRPGRSRRVARAAGSGRGRRGISARGCPDPPRRDGPGRREARRCARRLPGRGRDRGDAARFRSGFARRTRAAPSPRLGGAHAHDPVRALPRAGRAGGDRRATVRPGRRAAAIYAGGVSLTFTTAGESHGPGLVAIVEGLPAGLELDREALDRDMARRQLGHGRGGRMKIESDAVEIRSGIRHGCTLGSPVAVLVANRDYPNWEERMNPWPVEAEVEETHLPRPGHADLAGALKFGHRDVRNVLERASARETAARVAAGSLARGFLSAVGVSVHSQVIQIASVTAPERDDLTAEDFADVDDSPVRCLDQDASQAMVAEIDRLRKENESLGGKFEVRAFGLVPGIGSHVSWSEKLDGRLAQAICSIQSVKGVSP